MSRWRSRSRLRFPSFLPRLEPLELRDVPAAIIVDSSADSVASDGVTTLREAIIQANAQAGDDTITFDSKLTALGSATITLTDALPDLSEGITLTGPGANRLAITRSTAGGTPNFCIFTTSVGSVVNISGLTITGGDNTNDGGGIFNAGTLALSGVAITGNITTGFGGGLENNGGVVSVVDSTISGNSALSSGGIDTFNGGTLTLLGVTVSGNTASDTGGGIGIDTTAVTIVGSTVTNNRAATTAGGVFALGPTALRGSIVAGNFHGAGSTADDVKGSVDTSRSSFNIIGTGGAGGLVNGQNGNSVGVADAGLLPLAYNGGPVQTHALKTTSIARDAGTSLLTTLADPLDASTTSFNVLDGSFVAKGAVIRIDDEEMLVTDLTGKTVTVTRGVDATTPASHLQNASVRLGRDGRGLTRTKDFAGIANAVSGDGTDIGAFEVQASILGVGMGGQPIVKLYEADTQRVVQTINPFGVSDHNGLPFAVGDLTGDGIPDLAVARAGTVRVFDGSTGTQVQEFQPFGANYHGTLALATADLDGDGFGDLVVGTGPGALATVRVFSSRDWSKTWEFQPFTRFYGGVTLAADSGRIIVGTASTTSRVAVFNFGTKTRAGEFTVFAFGTAGVHVAAGDVNGDGVSDIVVSANQGTSPRVLIYRADTRTSEGQILWTGLLRNGLRVAVADIDGDGRLDVVVGQGKYAQPLVRAYSGSSFLELAGWQPFPGNNFLGGVLVG
jgi:hypothetical protein